MSSSSPSPSPSPPASPPPRRAVVVLCTRDGEVLGGLPGIPVRTPWWQDVAPVVEAVRESFGLEIVVLRMLSSALPRPQGGAVTYLVEIDGLSPGARASLQSFDGVMDDQPLRLPYAMPGGPAADLAWAEGVLRERRIERVGPPRQVRTWNLSSIWELPTAAGSAWLKVVPPFFGHEGDMLRRLQGGPVPRLLGHDGPRILMAEIPGEDQYDATLPMLRTMVSRLVELQASWIGRTDELLAMRLPDWRPDALTAAIGDVVARRGDAVDAAERAALEAFVRELPRRFAAVASCGLPDTFVHGDFHPGNVRGDGELLTLLDWGDTGVGHPLLDVPSMVAAIPDAAVEPVRAHWLEAWRAVVPSSDPVRAAALLEPIAAARQAVMYQRFVDGIEPVERRHHDADVIDSLRRTARVASSRG